MDVVARINSAVKSFETGLQLLDSFRHTSNINDVQTLEILERAYVRTGGTLKLENRAKEVRRVKQQLEDLLRHSHDPKGSLHTGVLSMQGIFTNGSQEIEAWNIKMEEALVSLSAAKGGQGREVRGCAEALQAVAALILELGGMEAESVGEAASKPRAGGASETKVGSFVEKLERMNRDRLLRWSARLLSQSPADDAPQATPLGGGPAGGKAPPPAPRQRSYSEGDPEGEAGSSTRVDDLGAPDCGADAAVASPSLDGQAQGSSEAEAADPRESGMDGAGPRDFPLHAAPVAEGRVVEEALLEELLMCQAQLQEHEAMVKDAGRLQGVGDVTPLARGSRGSSTDNLLHVPEERVAVGAEAMEGSQEVSGHRRHLSDGNFGAMGLSPKGSERASVKGSKEVSGHRRRLSDGNFGAMELSLKGSERASVKGSQEVSGHRRRLSEGNVAGLSPKGSERASASEGKVGHAVLELEAKLQALRGKHAEQQGGERPGPAAPTGLWQKRNRRGTWAEMVAVQQTEMEQLLVETPRAVLSTASALAGAECARAPEKQDGATDADEEDEGRDGSTPRWAPSERMGAQYEGAGGTGMAEVATAERMGGGIGGGAVYSLRKIPASASTFGLTLPSATPPASLQSVTLWTNGAANIDESWDLARENNTGRNGELIGDDEDDGREEEVRSTGSRQQLVGAESPLAAGGAVAGTPSEASSPAYAEADAGRSVTMWTNAVAEVVPRGPFALPSLGAWTAGRDGAEDNAATPEEPVEQRDWMEGFRQSFDDSLRRANAADAWSVAWSRGQSEGRLAALARVPGGGRQAVGSPEWDAGRGRAESMPMLGSGMASRPQEGSGWWHAARQAALRRAPPRQPASAGAASGVSMEGGSEEGEGCQGAVSVARLVERVSACKMALKHAMTFMEEPAPSSPSTPRRKAAVHRGEVALQEGEPGVAQLRAELESAEAALSAECDRYFASPAPDPGDAAARARAAHVDEVLLQSIVASKWSAADLAQLRERAERAELWEAQAESLRVQLKRETGELVARLVEADVKLKMAEQTAEGRDAEAGEPANLLGRVEVLEAEEAALRERVRVAETESAEAVQLLADALDQRDGLEARLAAPQGEEHAQAQQPPSADCVGGAAGAEAAEMENGRVRALEEMVNVAECEAQEAQIKLELMTEEKEVLYKRLASAEEEAESAMEELATSREENVAVARHLASAVQDKAMLLEQVVAAESVMEAALEEEKETREKVSEMQDTLAKAETGMSTTQEQLAEVTKHEAAMAYSLQGALEEKEGALKHSHFLAAERDEARQEMEAVTAEAEVLWAEIASLRRGRERRYAAPESLPVSPATPRSPTCRSELSDSHIRIRACEDRGVLDLSVESAASPPAADAGLASAGAAAHSMVIVREVEQQVVVSGQGSMAESKEEGQPGSESSSSIVQELEAMAGEVLLEQMQQKEALARQLEKWREERRAIVDQAAAAEEREAATAQLLRVSREKIGVLDELLAAAQMQEKAVSRELALALDATSDLTRQLSSAEGTVTDLMAETEQVRQREAEALRAAAEARGNNLMLMEQLAAQHPEVEEVAAQHPQVEEVAAQHPEVEEVAAQHLEVEEVAAQHLEVEEVAAQHLEVEEVAAQHPQVEEVAAGEPGREEDATRNLALVRQEKKALEQDLAEARAKCAVVAEELEVAKAQEQESGKKLADAQQESALFKKELQTSVSEREGLEMELARIQHWQGVAGEQMISLQQEKEALAEEVSGMRNAEAEVAQEMQVLREEKTGFSSKMESVLDTMLMLTDQVTKTVTEQVALVRVQGDGAGAPQVVNSVDEQLAATQSRNLALLKEVARARKEEVDMSEQLATVQEEGLALGAKLRDANLLAAEMRRELSETKRERAGLASRMAEVAAEEAEARRQLVALQQEKADASARVSAAALRESQAAEELEGLRQERSLVSQQLRAAQDQKEELAEELGCTQVEGALLLEELVALKRQPRLVVGEEPRASFSQDPDSAGQPEVPRHSVEDLKAQLEAVQHDRFRLVAELEAVQVAESGAMAEQEALRGERVQLEEALVAAHAEQEALLGELQESQTEEAAVMQRLNLAETEKSHVAQELAVAQRKMGVLVDELDASMAVRTELGEKLVLAEQAQAHGEESCAAAVAREKDATEQLAAAKREGALMANEITSAQERAQQAAEELAVLQQEKVLFEEQLRAWNASEVALAARRPPNEPHESQLTAVEAEQLMPSHAVAPSKRSAGGALQQAALVEGKPREAEQPPSAATHAEEPQVMEIGRVSAGPARGEGVLNHAETLFQTDQARLQQQAQGSQGRGAAMGVELAATPEGRWRLEAGDSTVVPKEEEAPSSSAVASGAAGASPGRETELEALLAAAPAEGQPLKVRADHARGQDIIAADAAPVSQQEEALVGGEVATARSEQGVVSERLEAAQAREAALMMELEEVHVERLALMEEIATATARVKKAAESFTALQQEKSATEQLLAASQADHAGTRESLSAATAARAEAEDQLRGMQEEARTRSEALRALESALATVSEEEAAARSEEAELKDTIAATRWENAALMPQAAEAHMSSSEAAESLQAMQQELASAEEQLVTMEAAAAAAAAAVEAAVEESTRLSLELDASRLEAERAGGEMAAAQQEWAAEAERSAAVAAAEGARTTERLEALRQEKEILGETLSETAADQAAKTEALRAARVHEAELDAQLAAAQHEMEGLALQVAAARDSEAAMSNDLQAARCEREALGEQLVASERGNAAIEARLTSAGNREEALGKKLMVAQEASEALAEQAAAASAREGAVCDDLRAAQREQGRLGEQLEAACAEEAAAVHALQGEASAAASQEARARSHMEAVLQQSEALESRLRQALLQQAAMSKRVEAEQMEMQARAQAASDQVELLEEERSLFGVQLAATQAKHAAAQGALSVSRQSEGELRVELASAQQEGETLVQQIASARSREATAADAAALAREEVALLAEQLAAAHTERVAAEVARRAAQDKEGEMEDRLSAIERQTETAQQGAHAEQLVLEEQLASVRTRQAVTAAALKESQRKWGESDRRLSEAEQRMGDFQEQALAAAAREGQTSAALEAAQREATLLGKQLAVVQAEHTAMADTLQRSKGEKVELEDCLAAAQEERRALEVEVSEASAREAKMAADLQGMQQSAAASEEQMAELKAEQEERQALEVEVSESSAREAKMAADLQ
eukprot:gene11321-13378_t